MECSNFTSYINNVNEICGDNINNVVEECSISCMISIVILLNSCIINLSKLNFDNQLEYIVSYCYNINHGNN